MNTVMVRPTQEPASPAALRLGVSLGFLPLVFKQGRDLAGAELDLARALGESRSP